MTLVLEGRPERVGVPPHLANLPPHLRVDDVGPAPRPVDPEAYDGLGRRLEVAARERLRLVRLAGPGILG